MLLTRIPFFKDVIIMSFECQHCGYTNNEVQSAGKVQDKGCVIKLEVSSPEVQHSLQVAYFFMANWNDQTSAPCQDC